MVDAFLAASRGEPRVVFTFSVGDDGLVTGIDLLADPATLAAMTIEPAPDAPRS